MKAVLGKYGPNIAIELNCCGQLFRIGDDWPGQRQQARFELGAYMDTARTSVNRQLNQELMKGIRSYGDLSELKLVGIYPMQQHLIIRSNCSGNLSVKVESINFSL